MFNCLQIRDKTARKWSTKTGEAELIFNGHSDFVKTIALVGSFLFTGSSGTHTMIFSIICRFFNQKVGFINRTGVGYS
jgi:hypothetical protein